MSLKLLTIRTQPLNILYRWKDVLTIVLGAKFVWIYLLSGIQGKQGFFSIEKGKTSEQYFNLNKPSHDVDNDKYRLKIEYFKNFIEGRKTAYSQIFTIPN